jgi:tetratricopeptide (TPR) repeat protein
MQKILTFLLVIILSLPAQAYSQESRAESVKKYKVAFKLHKEVTATIKSGDLGKAEKLYLEAFNSYPVYYKIDELPRVMLKEGNVKGANRLWEVALKAFQRYPEIVLVADYSDVLLGFHNMKVQSIVEAIYATRATANAEFGNVKQAYLDFKAYDKMVKPDPGRLLTLSILANQAGDFEASRRLIDTLYSIYKGKGTMYLSKQLQPVYAEAILHLFKGNYQQVLPLAQRLVAEDKGLNTTWRGYGYLLQAEAYASLGDLEKARNAYQLADKQMGFRPKSNNMQYVRGMIALLEKDYTAAVEYFNNELKYKYIYNTSFPDIIRRSLYYTKRAEAYEGQKDFVKAKSDYQAALLYDPEFNLALQGLAKLEGRIRQDLKMDKEGPKIEITSPELARGLKVTASGNEITVKGVAMDPSGLKSVLINGKEVYSREDGAFWGSLQLKSGNNLIRVQARDLAGNTAEHSFEISHSAVVAANPEIVPPGLNEGKNYALIIAAQNYDDSNIPSLQNPVADGIKLKLILKNNYNFDESNILTLFNPDKPDFMKKFLEVTDLLRSEDNLVIFYAGHGIWVEKEKKGYWLLTDAKRNDVNSWLANKDVLDLIAKVPSKHTLLITDACFSGSMFKTRSIGADAPAPIREMSEKISRVAITSGNDTEVPDESVFMKYLVKALSENKEKYLTAQKMFINQIIEAVMTESKTEPRYGTLESAGHIGGDYIFTKK